MRFICLALSVATLLAGASAYADGVGDGGGTVTKGEIVCEFPTGNDVIGFDVKHASNFYDHNAIVGLIKNPRVGWDYVDSLNLVRRHRNEIEGAKIVYSDEKMAEFSVTVSVGSFEMSSDDKAKLRYIGNYVGKDYFKLFNNAELYYPKRNLKLNGVCAFWL